MILIQDDPTRSIEKWSENIFGLALEAGRGQLERALGSITRTNPKVSAKTFGLGLTLKGFGKLLQYELHRESVYKCGWVEYASMIEAKAATKALNDRRMKDWKMRLQAYTYPGG